MMMSRIRLISPYLWMAGCTSVGSEWLRWPAAPESARTEKPLQDAKNPAVRPAAEAGQGSGGPDNPATAAWVIKLDTLHIWGGNLYVSLKPDSNNQSHFAHVLFYNHCITNASGWIYIQVHSSIQVCYIQVWISWGGFWFLFCFFKKGTIWFAWERSPVGIRETLPWICINALDKHR